MMLSYANISPSYGKCLTEKKFLGQRINMDYLLLKTITIVCTLCVSLGI